MRLLAVLIGALIGALCGLGLLLLMYILFSTDIPVTNPIFQWAAIVTSGTTSLTGIVATFFSGAEEL